MNTVCKIVDSKKKKKKKSDSIIFTALRSNLIKVLHVFCFSFNEASPNSSQIVSLAGEFDTIVRYNDVPTTLGSNVFLQGRDFFAWLCFHFLM